MKYNCLIVITAIVANMGRVATAQINSSIVHVPGTKVSLVPPKGFVTADRFPGFQQTDLSASIMVTEFPGPISEVSKGMTKSMLASRGMTLVSSQSEKVNGRNALILHVAQMAGGTKFLKWMLLIGDTKNSVMVVGTFPKDVEPMIGPGIKKAVLSTVWSLDLPIDPFEGLGFRVVPTVNLKIAGRMSNMLTLTASGKIGTLGPSDPVYLVGMSIRSVPISDLRLFSESRARQIAEIKELHNITGTESKMGEIPGYELLGEAQDAKTSVPMRVYVVVAPDEGGYFIAVGLVGKTRADEFVPEFRHVTASFQRQGKPKGQAAGK